MAFVLGKDGVLSYKSGGVAGGGSWTPITNATDVTVDADSETADITTRGGGGWSQEVATIRKLSIKFGMVWDTADTGFTTIRDAWLNNTVVGIRAFDSASHGPTFDAMVSKFTRNEPIKGAMMVDVELVSAYSATAPTYA